MSSVRRSARIAQAAKHSAPEEPKDAVPPPVKKTKTNAAAAASSSPSSSSLSSDSKLLKVGDPIPDITLKDENEEDVNLKDVASKNRIVAVFAYPKASTPGCTRQACGYSANFASLTKIAKVYGLSTDLPKAQKNFITKQSLKLDGLLSDPNKELIGVLGAKKSPTGVKRSHWIFVDGKLKISRVQISPETSVADGKKEIEEIHASFSESEGKLESEAKEEPKKEANEEVKEESKKEGKEDLKAEADGSKAEEEPRKEEKNYGQEEEAKKEEKDSKDEKATANGETNPDGEAPKKEEDSKLESTKKED